MATAPNSVCAVAKDLIVFTARGGVAGAGASVLTALKIISLARGAFFGVVVSLTMNTLHVLYIGIVVPSRERNGSLPKALQSFSWSDAKIKLGAKKNPHLNACAAIEFTTILVACRIFGLSVLGSLFYFVSFMFAMAITYKVVPPFQER